MGKGVHWNQWVAAGLVTCGFLLLSVLGNQGVAEKQKGNDGGNNGREGVEEQGVGEFVGNNSSGSGGANRNNI